jgi:hypothetical protein
MWVPIGGLALVVLCIGIVTGTLPLTTSRNVSTPDGLVTHSHWIVGPTVETNLVPLWTSEGFGGYQREANWPQYHALMETMVKVGAERGCGRALPENDPYGIYGTFYEFSLFPYWTDGCIDSLTGVPRDLSLNSTYVSLALGRLSWLNSTYPQPGVEYPSFDVHQGVPLLRSLGVRYYLADTPQAKAQAATDPGLELVASSGPWKIYQVNDVSLVQGLAHLPVVVPAASSSALRWLDATAPGFLGAHPEVRLAASGPPSWPRVADLPTAPGRPEPPVTVTRVRMGQNTVSFHVDRTGVPVEVRVTYFPWWTSAGAEGPWRLSPDDLVVVPTSHDVTLTAAPRTVDRLATVVSLVAVLATVGLAIWDRRRRHLAVAPGTGGAVADPADSESSG